MLFGFSPRHRWWRLAAVLALAPAAWPAQTSAEMPAEATVETSAALDLEEARALAARQSPELRALRAEVDEARARLLGARTYPFNPELEAEAARRSARDGSSTDRGLRLSQEIEIAGQRRRRTAAAEAAVAAAEAGYLRQRRGLDARVELAFAEAVRARELRDLERLSASLSRELLAVAEKRLAAGAATQLEVNLARAAGGRAASRVVRAEAAYRAACSTLAEAVGAEPAAPPEPRGEIPLPRDELPELAEVVRRAAETRADLDALSHLRREVEERIRLARAEARPNLTLSALYEREEGTDDLIGGGLALSLPLFDRNRAARAEAAATRDGLGYRRLALERSIEREVTAAWFTLSAAREAAGRLREEVLGSLEGNLALLRRAFEEGKVGAMEVLLLHREFTDSRRDWVDAASEAWIARITLDLAAGRLAPLPDPGGEEAP